MKGCCGPKNTGDKREKVEGAVVGVEAARGGSQVKLETVAFLFVFTCSLSMYKNRVKR